MWYRCCRGHDGRVCDCARPARRVRCVMAGGDERAAGRRPPAASRNADPDIYGPQAESRRGPCGTVGGERAPRLSWADEPSPPDRARWGAGGGITARRPGESARGSICPPCTFAKARTQSPECGVSRRGWSVDCSATHVFPPKRCIALAAEDVSDGVVASGHLAVHGLALNDVDTTKPWLATTYSTMHAADTYTASKRYARPC
jgi:hypothetical protein